MWSRILKRMAYNVWEHILLPCGVTLIAALVIACALAVPGHYLGVYTAPPTVLIVGLLALAGVIGFCLYVWFDTTRDDIRDEIRDEQRRKKHRSCK